MEHTFTVVLLHDVRKQRGGDRRSAPFSKGSAEPFETECSADHTASVLGVSGRSVEGLRAGTGAVAGAGVVGKEETQATGTAEVNRRA